MRKNAGKRLGQVTQSVTEEMVSGACEPRLWDVLNSTLYNLCEAYPLHKDDGHIAAKMMLIGRTYAAAIERRKAGLAKKRGDLYANRVVPLIKRSALDEWISEARLLSLDRDGDLTKAIAIHGKATRLFTQISGMENRSLASKYLHFHVPAVFYIFDSKANASLRRMVPSARDAKQVRAADPLYASFARRADALRRYCVSEYSHDLNPRQIDTLLLKSK